MLVSQRSSDDSDTGQTVPKQDTPGLSGNKSTKQDRPANTRRRVKRQCIEDSDDDDEDSVEVNDSVQSAGTHGGDDEICVGSEDSSSSRSENKAMTQDRHATSKAWKKWAEKVSLFTESDDSDPDAGSVKYDGDIEPVGSLLFKLDRRMF